MQKKGGGHSREKWFFQLATQTIAQVIFPQDGHYM
jgi:hypothetical protein